MKVSREWFMATLFCCFSMRTTAGRCFCRCSHALVCRVDSAGFNMFIAQLIHQNLKINFGFDAKILKFISGLRFKPFQASCDNYIAFDRVRNVGIR